MSCTRSARASASSTFERIARCSSSSETRPVSGVAWSGAAWSALVAWDEDDPCRAAASPAAGGAAAARPSAGCEKAVGTTSGTLAGSRPFSLRLYLTAMAASISCTTATKVSMTPSPSGPRPGTRGGPRGSGRVLISASAWRSGRSRLLYWRTSGTFSGTSRFASRLTFMFSKAARFSLNVGLARVGHEDDGVGAGQHHAPRRVVLDLARAPCRAGP